MAKKDKEFGEWQETTLVNGIVSVKRFEYGFIIKRKGDVVAGRTRFKRKTTAEDMFYVVGNYKKGG